MEANQDNNTFSSTPLAFGAACGLLSGAIAGPLGALLGSVAGAVLGFWIDSRRKSAFTTGEKSTGNNESEKTVAHQH